jgi:ABC-type transporter Mla subunit MlaD
MLRQKTLLGETYVELQPGRSDRKLAEGGRLPDGQVAKTVELDEIFDALDPRTRDAFRTWQQELGRGIEGHGRDVNAALGTLPGFATDADDVFGVLDSQEGAVPTFSQDTDPLIKDLRPVARATSSRRSRTSMPWRRTSRASPPTSTR